MHLKLNLKAPIPNKQVNLSSLGKVKSILITSSIGEVFWTASVNIVGIMVKMKRQRGRQGTNKDTSFWLQMHM